MLRLKRGIILGAYFIRRIIWNIINLWAIVTIVFLLMHVSGDPVLLLVPPHATAADIAILREAMGLDRPVIIQYYEFLEGAIRGDFGTSFAFRDSAWKIVLQHLIPTFQLAISALIVAVTVGIFLGVIASVKKNTVWDTIASIFALIGQSIPIFWLGLILIIVFSVTLGWLPASGRDSGLLSFILPVSVLATFILPSIVRLTRTSMLEVLSADYLRTARSKGLSEYIVIIKHALRNASLPVVTMIGIHVGKIIGGSVITETIFAWPGMGRLAIQALHNRDYPLIQATIFLVALSISISMLVVDLLYVILDPRISYD